MGAERFLIGSVAVLALTQVSGETTTPEGPATLYSERLAGQTDEGVAPRLLTGVRVTVQPGGRAGTVRVLAFDHAYNVREPGPSVAAGPPVVLPAEPGTYVLPAPHVLHDYRDLTLGIEQQAGGHAIAGQTRCAPEQGDNDRCAWVALDIYRPVLGTAVPDRRAAAETRRGARLLIEPVTEPDADRDGAGDETEDRTNLRATVTTAKPAGGRRAFDVTVENAGPRPADLPRLSASLDRSPGLGTWAPQCVDEPPPQSQPGEIVREQTCRLAPLAVGERRSVRFVAPDTGRGSARFVAAGDGPDLVPYDEFADADYADPRPALWVEVSPRLESFRDGRFSFKVHSARKGTVRVGLARGGRTYARSTITFRRAGGRSVVLRAPRNFFLRRGPATLTARSGGRSVKARFEPS